MILANQSGPLVWFGERPAPMSWCPALGGDDHLRRMYHFAGLFNIARLTLISYSSHSLLFQANKRFTVHKIVEYVDIQILRTRLVQPGMAFCKGEAEQEEKCLQGLLACKRNSAFAKPEQQYTVSLWEEKKKHCKSAKLPWCHNIKLSFCLCIFCNFFLFVV